MLRGSIVAFILGLIISQGGKTFLITLPNAPWTVSFQSGWLEQTLFLALCECQALSPLILSDGFSPSLALFSQRQVLIKFPAECLRGTLCRSLASVSMQLSLLSYSVLRILAILVSLDSQLCFLNSRRMPSSTWVPLSVPWPGNSLEEIN